MEKKDTVLKGCEDRWYVCEPAGEEEPDAGGSECGTGGRGNYGCGGISIKITSGKNLLYYRVCSLIERIGSHCRREEIGVVKLPGYYHVIELFDDKDAVNPSNIC